MIQIDTSVNWLIGQAKTNGKKIFLKSSHSGSFTFEQTFKEVIKYQQYFSTNGVNKNDKAAIIVEAGFEFIFSTLALWNLGAIPVPINMLWKEHQIYDILNLYKIKHIIADDNFSSSTDGQNLIPIKSENIPELISSDKVSIEDFELKNLSLILFTSGSTDKPKGVVFTFENLLQSFVNVDSFVKHNEHDVWLASIPFYHIGGFSIITRSLISGCEIYLPPDRKTDTLTQIFSENKITLASLVPTQLKRILQTGQNSPSKLRALFLGGGPAETTLLNDAIKLKYPVVKVYGSTETSSMVTAVNVSENPEGKNSAGKPLGDVVIEIDKNKNQEIKISSKAVAEYYLESDGMTSLKDESGFFHSGDTGNLQNEYLYLTDRLKRIIISGGENISASEIESILLQHPDVTDAYVISFPDDKWGEIPLAIIALRTDSDTILSEIIKYIADQLPSFKQPKRYLILDSIPRNELGKVDIEEVKELLKHNLP